MVRLMFEISAELGQKLMRFDRSILKELVAITDARWPRFECRVDIHWLDEEDTVLTLAITNPDDAGTAAPTMMLRAFYTEYACMLREHGCTLDGIDAVAWQDGTTWRYRCTYRERG